MKAKILDKTERLEVILSFPDSRLIDLEMALYLAAKPHGWGLERTDANIEHTVYKVTSSNIFLATIHITHGLEPPTKVVLENRPPGEADYWPAARQSLVAVTQAFLEECAARGLVSEAQKDKAIIELNAHDAELAPSR